MDQDSFKHLDKISHQQKANLLRDARWDMCFLHVLFFISALQAALRIGAGGHWGNWIVIAIVLFTFVSLYKKLGKLKLFIADEESRAVVEELIKAMIKNGDFDHLKKDNNAEGEEPEVKVVQFPCGTPVDVDKRCEECPETCEECKPQPTENKQ